MDYRATSLIALLTGSCMTHGMQAFANCLMGEQVSALQACVLARAAGWP